jgi:hypothetical protein
MAEAVTSAVSTMNDTLAKVFTEKHKRGTHDIRNQFSGAFRGIGGDLMKRGLQNAEGALFKGLAKKDGSSESNALWVRMAGLPGGGGTAGTGSSIGGGILSKLMGLFGKSGGGGGDSAQGIASALGVAFQGFFADGGDLMGGMPAIVGEKGPELFVPPSSGSIIPNSRLGKMGGDTHYNIDARGATDPAATSAAVKAAIIESNKQTAAAVVKHMNEQNMRTPHARRS